MGAADFTVKVQHAMLLVITGLYCRMAVAACMDIEHAVITVAAHRVMALLLV